jgi:hypothetical protein
MQDGQAAADVTSGGAFSHRDRRFTYTTPTGGHAVIHFIGIGNLTGTTVDSSGALHLVYGGTNAYTKIVSEVHGGGGLAPLASILNSQLVNAGQTLSLTGVGGNVLASVKMGNFDLIAGGTINLTPGVGSLILHSIGPSTQVNLRTLPPAPTPSSTTLATSSVGVVTTPSGSQGAVLTTPTTTSSSTSSTLQAGQTTTITTSGVSATYTSDGSKEQSLTNLSGVFTAGSNLKVPLATGQPPSIPPAPPGLILKVDTIGGSPSGPIDLLTDSKIFGYDPTTGQLARFNLDFTKNTGALDPTFAPINVPGDRAVVSLNLGRDGNQLVVLVSSGPTVYAYNATTGAAVGSFTAGAPINSIGSTDTLSVLGSFQTNRLQMINVAASLQAGHPVVVGSGQPFTPQAGFTLLGGLTGLPASSTVYATVAATFNSFQPSVTELGVQSIGTGSAVTTPRKGTTFSNGFSSGTHTAITERGTFVPVDLNPTPPPVTLNQVGDALGAVDQSLALVAGSANGHDLINLYNPSTLASRGVISLNYPDRLAGLSGTFRPDLAGSVLVDIQGNVQSVRGGTANGLVLNDAGNLNLVKFVQVTNSTIVGQPISHLQIKRRSATSIVSSKRDVDGRNGVVVDTSILQIGPLSQSHDG